MTEKKPARKATTKSASKGFTAEEREAMRERAKELKAARGGKGNDESAVLEKLASLAESDRKMGERIHAIIKANAPGLSPKLWYGMPAYAVNGNVVCFFQGAQKFKTRYSTLGFTDKARLDNDHMWATGFALLRLDETVEAKIIELIKKAVA